MKERIKKLRKDRKLTQIEFAKKIGIAQSSLSEIEKGTIPSAEILIKICSIFGIDGNWLLTGVESDYLSDEEKELIKRYRTLSEREKGRIDEILGSHRDDKEYIKEGNLSS